MVVSYTNNYGYTDAYANKGVNTLTTNGDGGGNGGGGAFMKMFEEQESEEAKKEKETPEDTSNPLDDIYNIQQNYYASQNVIRDYIDNSLLLNTEQVACTNITQHLALKNNVKETLKFLNLQAAKSMVNSRKRNYNFHTSPQPKPVLHVNSGQEHLSVSEQQDISSVGENFFNSKSINANKNFFIS